VGGNTTLGCLYLDDNTFCDQRALTSITMFMKKNLALHTLSFSNSRAVVSRLVLRGLLEEIGLHTVHVDVHKDDWVLLLDIIKKKKSLEHCYSNGVSRLDVSACTALTNALASTYRGSPLYLGINTISQLAVCRECALSRQYRLLSPEPMEAWGLSQRHPFQAPTLDPREVWNSKIVETLEWVNGFEQFLWDCSKDRILAVVMGMHTRLGNGGCIMLLDDEVLRKIVDCIYLSEDTEKISL
jgi:hypothetical protein